jgi:hypothetical protein
MADSLTAAECADIAFEVVKAADGKKLLKPMDVLKMLKAEHGADRRTAKDALQILTTDGRCVYEYAGGSYLKLDPSQKG